MGKKRRLYMILSVGAALILLVGVLLIVNGRGMPTAALGGYVQASTAAPASDGEAQLQNLADSTEGVAGMKLVVQDQGLGLYYDEETAEIAVRQPDGTIWYSNPRDRDTDPLASKHEKAALASQLSISFRDAVGTLETFTSFADSVANAQFKVSEINQGIRVTYTIGDTSLGIEALPRLIQKERLEQKVLANLDESAARYVSARYYPTKADPNVLERLDGQVSKPLVLSKMLAAFEQAGYTPEDLAEDNQQNGIESAAVTEKPSFVVPVEYRLDHGSLLVTVPLGQVEEKGQYRIRSLDLLSYFGAAGSKEQGYMLVPDGSGSLIHLNNGKNKDEQYTQRVYDADLNDSSLVRSQISESIHMPVFGLKSGDRAWFAVIEQGDGIAGISAGVGGGQNSYNHAYSSFYLRGEDELEMYTSKQMQEIQMLNEEPFRGDVRVRYHFLEGKDANYSGMARGYRESLIAQGELKPNVGKEQSDLPFYVDVLGTADKQTSFLGVPYRSIVPMTTYQQAEEIIDQLTEQGIRNVQMRYQGWLDGGVNHHTPTKAKLERAAGSRSEMMKLAEHLNQVGGQLYLDVAFQRVYHNDSAFSPASDAARFVTKDIAERYPYNPARGRMDTSLDSYYLLSAAKLPYVVDEFIRRTSGWQLEGLALRDLGELLSADYRDHRVVHRETAKQIVREQLDKLSTAYPELLLSSANAYAWPYTAHIVDVPSGSSRFDVQDEEVPFYQMVLHGSVDYAAAPMNMSGDQDLHKQFLKSLELGAAPSFEWTYEPSSLLKMTEYSQAYATEYSAWLADATALYQEANKVLGPLRGQQIERHERIGENGVRVDYSDGTALLINYGAASMNAYGMTVAPESYVVTKGGTR